MSASGSPRRIAVITTEIGVRSEIWMLRQLAAFERLEPVLFGWTEAQAPTPLPPGLEVRRFRMGDTRRPDLKARLFRRLGSASGYLPDAATRRHIRDTLAEADVEGVLCHFAWNAIPVAAALDGRLPIVAQVHGRDVSTMLANPSYRRALAATLPRIDFLAAVGRFQLERLRPLGLPAAHEVIPCGAPTAVFGTSPLPNRSPGSAVRFITVGRISAEKGVLETLAAFETVHAAHPASELLFVGEGPAEADLDRAITASPANSAVRRTGYLPPPELARLLSTCHVLVQHSREVGGWVEGFGVMLAEGGAAGLALVASDFGGIPDQVQHATNGLLFAPGDTAAQAAAMLRLAEHEDVRRRLGENARRIAQTFDSRLLAGRMEARILDAIEAHGARAKA